jgi:hypothetical protein
MTSSIDSQAVEQRPRIMGGNSQTVWRADFVGLSAPIETGISCESHRHDREAMRFNSDEQTFYSQDRKFFCYFSRLNEKLFGPAAVTVAVSSVPFGFAYRVGILD